MDSVEDAPPTVLRSDVWYDDGNIILQTGKGTPDEPFTQFRVYKGFLATKSSVFRDMLVVAESSAEEMVDACPIVQLDDDKEELSHVLRALHMDTRCVIKLSEFVRVSLVLILIASDTLKCRRPSSIPRSRVSCGWAGSTTSLISAKQAYPDFPWSSPQILRTSSQRRPVGL